MNKNRVIYILSNPTFPQYVKIGFTNDIEERLGNLNTAVPFNFKLEATYEIPKGTTDKAVTEIIDGLNPTLRAPKSEFFEMSVDDAYKLLSNIAKLNGNDSKLKRFPLSEEEIIDKEYAEEVYATYEKKEKKRAENFSFKICNIKAGEKIEYCKDSNITAVVVDDKHIEYNGERMSLTSLAKKLSGKNYSLAGPLYFKYKGEFLNDLRSRLGV